MSRSKKNIILIISMVVISVLVFLGSSIRAFASSGSSEEYHKYYTCITLESGDTLWDLANDYAIDGVMSRKDFMNEACRLNHIGKDTILKTGDTLAIAYYSTELK